MKKIFSFIFLTTFFINAFSQKKSNQPKLIPVETSTVSKADKWVENFVIKQKKYKVYTSYNDPKNSALRQKKGDTLQIYKILDNKYIELEINKYATRNGKIIRESSYTVKNDTLIIITDDYDYTGAYRTTDKYVTYKYGLKKISDTMKAIDTDTLSDKYLKSAEMSSISED